MTVGGDRPGPDGAPPIPVDLFAYLVNVCLIAIGVFLLAQSAWGLRSR